MVFPGAIGFFKNFWSRYFALIRVKTTPFAPDPRLCTEMDQSDPPTKARWQP